MSRMSRPLWRGFVLLLGIGYVICGGLFCSVQADETGAMRVEQAWIRLAPPTAMMTAGYAQIYNNTNQTKVLVGAQSDRFGSIEIHRTEIQDGVARMVQQDRIVIEPHQALSLAPGGYHLMLMALTTALKPDENIPVQLQWAEGEPLRVDFTVMAEAPAPAVKPAK